MQIVNLVEYSTSSVLYN